MLGHLRKYWFCIASVHVYSFMATRLTKQVVKYRWWRFTAVFALFASWGNGHPGSGHNTTRPQDERDVNQ